MPPKKRPRPSRKPTTSTDQNTVKAPKVKPICSCDKPSFGGKSNHFAGKREPTLPSINTGFLSIKFSVERICSYAVHNELELVSSAANLFFSSGTQERANRINDENIAKQQAAIKKVQREKEEARTAAEAKKKAVGFLSFRYSRSVEERLAVGSWPQELLVLSRDKSLQTKTTVSERLADKVGTRIPIENQTSNEHRSQSADNTTGTTQITLRKASQRNFALALSPSNSLDLNHQSQLSVLESDTGLPSPIRSRDMSVQPAKDITGGVDQSIKDVIQNLYILQQHVHGFRNENQELLNSQVRDIAQSIERLEGSVSKPDNPLHNVKVAPEIIDYVEDGRNPDIFTRDFVELVQRGNAVLNGKQQAFKDFSKVFAKALSDNFDGMDNEIDLIMGDAGMIKRNGKFVEKRPSNGTSAV